MATSKLNIFTLLEVIIAIAILSIGIASTLTVITMSKKRLHKTERLWIEQHLLTQAAEYIMLAPPHSSIPQEIFSSQDYGIKCEYAPASGMPENVRTEIGDWRLLAVKIQLFRKTDQQIVNSIIIDRIVRSKDL